MLAIVGSGFGLYGYLPAVAGRAGGVVLPEAYRAKVEARAELSPYLEGIRWVADEAAALARASTVVIAVPPRRQHDVALHCAGLPHVRELFLEKPLAPSPAESTALLAALRSAGKRVRVGYTFEHAAWAPSLRWPADNVTIEWTFMAHHFRHDLRNWKRDPAEGGGALRFFGVHLVAFLARRGYLDVETSILDDDAERWSAAFTGPGLPRCEVYVATRASAAAFRITAGKPLVALDDPFAGEAPEGGNDRRVAVLARHVATMGDPDGPFDAWYRDTNALWGRVEAASRP